MLARLRQEARALSVKDAAREILKAFERNDLLTYASAISFQVFFALIPLMLFGLAVLSGVGLQEIWTHDAAPKLKDSMSPAAFQVVNETVQKVLKEKQVFWATIGAVIAVWEMSGAARAVMGVFDRIYSSDRKRDFKERYLVSILLSIGAGSLLLGAVAAVELGRLVVDGPLGLVRWLVALVLLSACVALFVRVAPSSPRPTGWVTFGSMLVVVAWVGTSLVFGFYLTHFADYGNVFGALATIIVAFEYLYLSSIAFLTGAQLDALIADQLEGDPSGNGRGGGKARRGRKRTRTVSVR
jgi:membrane protein